MNEPALLLGLAYGGWLALVLVRGERLALRLGATAPLLAGPAGSILVYTVLCVLAPFAVIALATGDPFYFWGPVGAPALGAFWVGGGGGLLAGLLVMRLLAGRD